MPARPDSPCFKCTDRHMNYHSQCDKYKEFKISMERYNKELKEINSVYYANVDYLRECKERERERKTNRRSYSSRIERNKNK